MDKMTKLLNTAPWKQAQNQVARVPNPALSHEPPGVVSSPTRGNAPTHGLNPFMPHGKEGFDPTETDQNMALFASYVIDQVVKGLNGARDSIFQQGLIQQQEEMHAFKPPHDQNAQFKDKPQQGHQGHQGHQ